MGRDYLGVSFVLAPTLAHDALRLALRSLVVTTSTMVSQSKTGRITALKIVPIRTGLGTMAVLVGSVVAVIILWNYVCDELGTGRCYR